VLSVLNLGFRTQLEHNESDTADIISSRVRAFLNLSDVAFVQVCDVVVHCDQLLLQAEGTKKYWLLTEKIVTDWRNCVMVYA
jgi:hypothetical protein